MKDFIFDLTNRGSFVWERFPSDPDFVPRELPGHAEAVRRGLCLDREDTDFFVVGALASLLGCHWIGESAGDLSDLLVLALYAPPKDSWSGGELKAGPKDPAVFAFSPDRWPPDMTTTLERLDENKALLRNGVPETVAAVLNPDNRLKVDWPARYRAMGVVDLSADWEAGGQVEIRHEAASYPWREAAEYLGAMRETNQLLLNEGLAAGWHAARSDMERIALLALGLIRAYRSST